MAVVRRRILDGLVLQASITEYDDFEIINEAKLLLNTSDEIVLDLSIFDNQELVRKALNKKLNLPIFEWEVSDYLEAV